MTELRLAADKRNESSRTMLMKALLYGLRILINLASVAAVVGSFYLIKETTKFSADKAATIKQVKAGNNQTGKGRRQ